MQIYLHLFKACCVTLVVMLCRVMWSMVVAVDPFVWDVYLGGPMEGYGVMGYIVMCVLEMKTNMYIYMCIYKPG